MKILVLRIFSHSERYDKMYDIHRKYGDESIYVIHNPDLESEYRYTDTTKLLEIKGHETYIPGILIKTLKAIDICLKLFDFDILVRSNISTIINKDVLEEKLSKHDISGLFYGGSIVNLISFQPQYGYTIEQFNDLYGLKYIPGTNKILSRELCYKLITGTLDYTLLDDLSIGKFCLDNNIMPVDLSNRNTIAFDLKRLTQEQLISGTKTAMLYPFHRFRTDNDYDITNMELYYETQNLIISSNIGK